MPCASRALRQITAFTLSAGLLAPVVGCIAPRRVEPLGEAVRTYNEAIRWERFELAAARLPPRQRDDFLDERDRLREDLRITGYEVVRARHDSTGRRARVHIKYTWHRDSRGIVHTTHTVQRWERPRSDWVLLEERYLRGEPMPGVKPGPDGREFDNGPDRTTPIDDLNP